MGSFSLKSIKSFLLSSGMALSFISDSKALALSKLLLDNSRAILSWLIIFDGLTFSVSFRSKTEPTLERRAKASEKDFPELVKSLPASIIFLADFNSPNHGILPKIPAPIKFRFLPALFKIVLWFFLVFFARFKIKIYLIYY